MKNVFSDKPPVDWNLLSPAERLEFCKTQLDDIVRTVLPWEQMSPTVQLLMKLEGVSNTAVWEA